MRWHNSCMNSGMMIHPHTMTIGKAEFQIDLRLLPGGSIILMQADAIIVIPPEMIYSIVQTMGNWVRIEA